MNSSLPISEYVQENADSFIRLYSLSTLDQNHFNEAALSKDFDPAFIRYYSKSGILLTDFMKKTGFDDWFDRSAALCVYSALQEGSFDFLDPYTEKFKIDSSLLRYEYGPRQYLKSFSAFSIYCPINFFGITSSVNSFTSSQHRYRHAASEAILDLKNKNCQQVLIAGSKNKRAFDQGSVESLFYLVTNNSDYLGPDLIERLEHL